MAGLLCFARLLCCENAGWIYKTSIIIIYIPAMDIKMRDIPSVGMLRLFNNAILQKMKNMDVERITKYQIGVRGEKYYTNENRSAYIQRIDRTLSSDGSGRLVRHFYVWKQGNGQLRASGQLLKCETEAELKKVIRKLNFLEREYFFIKYLLKDKCLELFSNIENPEIMDRIDKSVDDYLDSRYRNYGHIPSFTLENVGKWMNEDAKFNSSYNFIRSRMITELNELVERQRNRIPIAEVGEYSGGDFPIARPDKLRF